MSFCLLHLCFNLKIQLGTAFEFEIGNWNRKENIKKEKERNSSSGWSYCRGPFARGPNSPSPFTPGCRQAGPTCPRPVPKRATASAAAVVAPLSAGSRVLHRFTTYSCYRWHVGPTWQSHSRSPVPSVYPDEWYHPPPFLFSLVAESSAISQQTQSDKPEFDHRVSQRLILSLGIKLELVVASSI